MLIWFVVGILSLLVITWIVRSKTTRLANERIPSVNVVLIGASIGQSWHLTEWPTRTNVSGFTTESISAWQFDKSEALEEVLMRPSRKFHLTRTYLKSLLQPPPGKPNIVIIKECSSYYPGDLKGYKRSIQQWVGQIRAKQITPMLATVVPVTKARAEQNSGKQQGLLEYNDWVREYAQSEGLQVLDLEVALRVDETERYLREEYAASDGSHLNPAAYAVLDEVLRKVLFRSQTATLQGQPVVAVGK